MVTTKKLNTSLLVSSFMQTINNVKLNMNNNLVPNNGKVENVYYVLPAYNEEESIPNLLKRISNINPAYDVNIFVIVVNDGSQDKTEEVIKNNTNGLNITLVNHEQNMGLGQAVQTGIKEALTKAGINDIIIIMDADDTHDVNLLDEMISKIEEGADIVIASRFVEGGNDKSAPPFRRLLSRGASLVFKTLLPLSNIKDFTSGYRAYRVSLLSKVSHHYGETLVMENGFACMVELLLKLRHWSPKIVEIPFFLRYDRKLGASKLKLFKTLLQYLKLGIRDRLLSEPRRK